MAQTSFSGTCDKNESPDEVGESVKHFFGLLSSPVPEWEDGKTIPWCLFKGLLETLPILSRGGMSALLSLFPKAFLCRAEEKEQKRPGVHAFSPKLPQYTILVFVGSGWAMHKAASPCSGKALDTYYCSFFLPPLFSGCPTVRNWDILCS